MDGDQRAAALAYYLLLSLFPMLVLFVTVGSVFGERVAITRALVRSIENYSPLTRRQELAATDALRGLLEARGTISLAAAVLLSFGGSAFLRALIRTTNRIWNSTPYSWWRLPLKSLSLLGITSSAIVVGILLPAAARLARRPLTADFGFPEWAFALLFKVIPWLVLFYGLVMIYKLAPSRPTRLSELWIGALAATALIWIGEELFFVYATHVARFNLLYGSLGVVVALLLWIYFSSCVCLLGVCFCAARAQAPKLSSEPVDESRE